MKKRLFYWLRRVRGRLIEFVNILHIRGRAKPDMTIVPIPSLAWNTIQRLGLANRDEDITYWVR